MSHINRRAEVKSVPCVSTRYGQSTCSEVRKWACKCAQPICNATLKTCFFTTIWTTSAIIYNMSGCVESYTLYTDLAISCM